jgi:hypothetical protein
LGICPSDDGSNEGGLSIKGVAERASVVPEVLHRSFPFLIFILVSQFFRKEKKKRNILCNLIFQAYSMA